MAEQTCYRCGGAGVVEKQEYTVELDANGNQVPKHHSYLGPCDACGGSGKVH
jgi:RecJ-like exonuclease